MRVQQLVEIEDRAELAADLGERLERAGVCAFVLEQPGVLDGHRDVRAELPQDHLVGLGELAGRVAEQVERADDAALAAKRHDELGARAGHRLDVTRIGVHVVDEQRLALGDRGADQPLPDLHPQRAGELVRIADRVGDRQLVALGIQQVDGKGVKRGQARDELRDLVQQLVEIEHRCDLASQLEQRRHELADIRGRSRLAAAEASVRSWRSRQ